MKAKPLKLIGGIYEPCSLEEVTHIRLVMPCPISDRILPVITKGDRKNTPCWTWNGDTEKPTLKPSILTKTENYKEVIVCHSFVTDGKVQFLGDCTHEFAGQTLELLEVD
jgi:hypothetical protein